MTFLPVAMAAIGAAVGASPPDARAFPDAPALFQEVLDNQSALEKVREDYTYTKTVTEYESDGRDRGRQKSERVYEVFYASGREIENLVAKDGRPLTEKEARKEQGRVTRVMRRHERKRAERGEGGRAQDDEGVAVSRILHVCRFVNPRREPLRGQEMLVYDFEPQPGSEARRRLESWIQKLRGTVWIEEQARRIARLEAHVKDPIKMAGGLLLSVRRGSRLVFEQALVNGEVWLPSYGEVDLSARFLLVKGLRVRQTQRFSAYKKFAVDTSSEIHEVKP